LEKADFKLVIIGGGEDKRADKLILKEIVRLSGEDKAHIGIVTTATEYPEEVGGEYERIFDDLGVKDSVLINISDRKRSELDGKMKWILELDCLFFVGGDQLRISSIIGGTNFHKALHEFCKEGKVIAGTSAGASMMSEVMIVEGEDEMAPRKCTIKMAPGMGLIEGVLIDQHFSQRGRIGRLLAGVAQNPNIIGIGIDEDTAIVVNGGKEFTVIGKGVVTVVDGRSIQHTNISEQHPDEPLALTYVTLHILPEGHSYSLINKMPIIKKNIDH